MKKLFWSIMAFVITGLTAAAAFSILLTKSNVPAWLCFPTILFGAVLATGCLEKSCGAGFFPWKWVTKNSFKGKPNAANQGSTTCESARDGKRK